MCWGYCGICLFQQLYLITQIHQTFQEASWESMRRSLEAQIKAQGGYVDPSYQQDAGVVHPDYAAKTGNQAFHPSLEGRKER